MADVHNSGSLILASASPARREILEQLGYNVTVCPSHVPEDILEPDPAARVEALSLRKLASAMTLTDGEFPVITADTLLYFNSQYIGKPVNKIDAERILCMLSGNTHRVFTGFAVSLPNREEVISGYDMAEVNFHDLGKHEISTYISKNEWQGAAGAYRIQGAGLRLISLIKGSYFTIVGLPIHRISGILRERGF